MIIKDSLFFSYDNVTSESMGLWNVNIGSGLLEETLFANKSIKETRIRGRDKSYFVEIEREPLVIPVSFAFQDTWDESKMRNISRWLNQKYYKPLQFFNETDLEEKIFYALPSEDSQIIHNGLKQGYLQLNFRCDSPFAYSKYYEESVDASTNPTSINHIINNRGDTNIHPIIEIQKVGTGSVKITNLSNAGEYIRLNNLQNNEIVYIDGSRKYISTDIPLTYRYGDMETGSKFIQLVTGNNTLSITGTCKINFVYQFKYYT